MTSESILKVPLKVLGVNKERVKELKLLLKHNSKTLDLRVKYRIIRAFRFENYAAVIKLYSKKTEKRTEFVRSLEKFFFVGETYFYLEPKDSKIFGVIMLSRFKNLLDIGMRNAIKHKGQFDKVPDLSWVLFGTPCKGADFSQVNVRELTTILARYRNLIEDGYFMEDVIKAFISKKPVTSIEISNLKPKIVNQLIKDLEKFFFVSRGYCDPDLWKYNFFVSRYKTLPKIISFYSKNNFGTYDRFSDVAGAFLLDLLENPSQEVASYCFDKRLKEHNFIK